MDPLISVVIPVFNEEKRIERAVQSMRDQTYRNLEIIVVDDGSTDGTWAILERLAKEDSRIKIFRAPKLSERRTNWRGYDINAGYAARNFGFKQARGRWITTQDADDASLLNRIEIQHRLAERYGAKLITVQWQQLTPETLGKRFDLDRLIADEGEDELVIRPERLAAMAAANRGPLMIEPIHRFIPFPVKWFPYTRKLFYKRQDPYLGADNCMFFDRSLIDEGIFFRRRNERTWGTPSGRGSGRDFVYRVALRYKNSWSFRIPLYLWNVKVQNPDYIGCEKYLIP